MIEDLHNAIVHDADFEDGKNTHITFRASNGDHPYPSGVVWNCSIKRVHPSSSKSQYGVRVAHGPDHNAPSPFPVSAMYLGKKNNQDIVVTVEDCIFDHIYHAVAGFSGAHYVLRNSTFSNNRSGVDLHGPTYSSDGRRRGARAAEIYNNTFLSCSKGTSHIEPRSGGGIIFNNIFKHSKYYLWFQGEAGHRGRERGSAVDEADSCYKAGRVCDPGDSGCYQFNNSSRIKTDNNENIVSLACENTPSAAFKLTTPMTKEAGFEIPKFWYIWGNDVQSSIDHGETICVADSGIENYVAENETYWLRAPTTAIDGFEWEPSTYPHVLRKGVIPNPVSNVPVNLRVVAD